MKPIPHFALCIFLAGLFTGCGNQESATNMGEAQASAGSSDPAPVVSSGHMFDQQISKQACDLLTPEVMAKMVRLEPAALEQKNIAGMCLYTWEGGQAHLGSLRTNKSIEAARRGFENSYRTQSAEQAKKDFDAISAKLKTQSAAAEAGVDPAAVEQLGDAFGDAMAGGFQFVAVEGLGDAASFNATRTDTEYGGNTFVSYANNLSVLVGNLHYTVGFALDGEPQMYPEQCEALARIVLDLLPR
jgi:hypothetical protein